MIDHGSAARALRAALLPRPESAGMVQIQYDREADALAIEFVERPDVSRTVKVTDTVRLDFDRDGRLVVLELLDASFHVPRRALERLAPTTDWLTLQEAAAESGLSPTTLRVQLNHGRLKGEKRGRDWFVDGAALFTYLDSRSARGRPPARGTRGSSGGRPEEATASPRRAKASKTRSRRKAAK
jgi:uncharacterized protein YuzE